MSYNPINCTFHDIMLDRITRRKNCIVQFKNESKIEIYKGKLIDVYSKEGEEFLVGENNFKIRLDRIVTVDAIENK